MSARRHARRPFAEVEEEVRSVFATTGDAALDRVAAIVAWLSDDPVEPDQIVAQFDELAEQAPAICVDADAVLRFVFGDQGFKGNRRDYYNPANSYIHRVLTTRLGIPITLAIVAIETGRRLGVPLTPVGFPSHFLVGDGLRADRWFDPFESGRSLDVGACQDLLTGVHPGASLEPSHTAVLSSSEVAHRMLNNLRHIHLTLGDLGQAALVGQLAVLVPGAGPAHRAELIRLLVATGRYDAAAEQHEILAVLDSAHESQHLEAARRLRFNCN